MPDKQLTCIECKNPFVFTEAMHDKLRELAEQGKIDRYNEPKRCLPCRQAKKQRNRSQGN